MKILLLSAAFCVVCLPAFPQGTLNFANAGVGFQAEVTDTAGVGLSGSAWSADLFWAPGVVSDSSMLMELGAPATFSTVAAQAGYFFGGSRTVPTTPHVPITVQVRVWDTASGASWTFAQSVPGAVIGASILFQVSLADPNTTPPEIPANLTGLGSLGQHSWSVSIVSVPEPSALALAALGTAALLYFNLPAVRFR